MGYDEFSASLTNRSLRTVRTELEFLADNGIITRIQLSKMLDQLPAESSPAAYRNGSTVPPTSALNNVRLNSTTPITNGARNNEKANHAFADPPANYNPPPAYGTPAATQSQQPPPPPPAPTAAPQPTVLTHAVSLYTYNGTDVGDLNLQPEDRIAVTEYMNAEWWKGRNERSGQEGIFPRSYVRVEERALATQSASSYGNMPLAVSQGGAPQSEDPKKPSAAKKIGGKLGNAAIFGAGATIGSNIVNSIF